MALTTRVNTPLEQVLAINKQITRELLLQQSILQRNQALSGRGRGPAGGKSGGAGMGPAQPVGPSRVGPGGPGVHRSGGVGSVESHGASRTENIATSALVGALAGGSILSRGRPLMRTPIKKTINQTFREKIFDERVGETGSNLNRMIRQNPFLRDVSDKKLVEVEARMRASMKGRGISQKELRTSEYLIQDPFGSNQMITVAEARAKMGMAREYLKNKRYRAIYSTSAFVRGNRIRRAAGMAPVPTLWNMENLDWQPVTKSMDYVQNARKAYQEGMATAAATRLANIRNNAYSRERARNKILMNEKEKARLSSMSTENMVKEARRLGVIQPQLIKQEVLDGIDKRVAGLMSGDIKYRVNNRLIKMNQIRMARGGIDIDSPMGLLSMALHPVRTARGIKSSIAMASKMGLGATELMPALSSLAGSAMGRLGFLANPATAVAAGIGMAYKMYSSSMKEANDAISANVKSDRNLAGILQGSLGREFRQYRSSVSRSGPSSGLGLLFSHDPYSSHAGNVAQQSRLYNLSQMGWRQAEGTVKTGSVAAGIWDSLTWTQNKPFIDRMKSIHKLKDRFAKGLGEVLGDRSLGVDALNDAYGGRIATGRMVLNKANGTGSVSDIMPQAAANVNFMLESSQTAPEIVNAVSMAASTLQLVKKRNEEQQMWDSLPENYEPIRIKRNLAAARETLDIQRIQNWNRQ